MRVKTEARRNAIVSAAAQAFRERGFDAASMGDIAQRVGGSKATLYNYFQSKEELFAAVMLDAAKDQASPFFDAFCAAADLREGFLRFGTDYLTFVLQPDMLAINRISVADGGRTGVSRVVYEQGVKIAWLRVADRLAQAMQSGELRQADPWYAAWHFKGLMEAGILDRALRGCGDPPQKADIEASVARAVDVFMRGYSV